MGNRVTKDSGIEWIGEIPESWEVKKGKYVFEERMSVGNSICLQLLSPTQKFGVIPQSLYEEYTTQRTVKVDYNKDISAFKTIRNGDYCISLRSFQGGFEYCTYEGVVSPAYKVFYPKEEVDRGYYKYLFKDKGFISKIASYSDSLRDGKSISFREFGNTVIPIPPLPEQKAIADYLDAKCAEIDSLKADITEQIEVLKQYKQSVITEAVTKGLDPDVPMKDSGIKWIGEIPESWEVIKLKYAMNNFDSQRKPIEAQKRDQDGDVLYDYYGASGVIDKINDYIFDKPAILIGEDGANLLLRNLPLIYIATGKYWVNNHAHILRPKNIISFYYAAYLLEALDYTVFITGSAQPKLSQENLNNVKMVRPPMEEQKAIADYLDAKCAEIDPIIEAKGQQLEALEEYKKSMIYEYVTGKKEVPQEV